MEESNSSKNGSNATEACEGRKVDIYQANFEHYYRMAMDHHTKAGTTSQILLAIVGALLVLLGYDDDICRNPIDIGSALFIILFGAFGAVWAATQIARYRYWEYIAFAYQRKIKKIIPEFKTRYAYKRRAEVKSGTAYPNLRHPINIGPINIGPVKIGRCIMRVKDRYLWVLLHVSVFFMGVVLLLTAVFRCCK